MVAVNSEPDAELFLEYLKGLHHCVKFTMEKEDSGILPFLDILIKRLEDGISTTIYRKKTHSGVYSHYKCFIPEKFKRTLIYTLVDRAWKICSTYQLWHREISYLKTMLMSNGYTRRFIEFQVHRYLSTIYDQNAPPPKKLTYGPDKLRFYIRLPYLGAANHKLEGCIRTCFKRIKAGGFQLVIINKYIRLKDWFGVKDRIPKLMRSNVVYKLECSCGKYYIGQTERCLKVRVDEHKKTCGKLTTVGEHCAENTTHKIDYDNVQILGSTDKFRLKYLESLIIQKHWSTGLLLNDAESSVKLNLFNVPIYTDKATNE